jgi:hypothetical protein
MGRGLACLVVLLLATAAAALADGQEMSGSAMVVVIRGGREYHQPSCPLVTKAGSNVKVMKLADARAQGLTAHDCEGAAIDQPKKDANATVVYVQDGDKRYHKAGCPKLGANPARLTVGEAGRKYWPCPVCKPPIRQRESASVPTRPT